MAHNADAAYAAGEVDLDLPVMTGLRPRSARDEAAV